MGFCWFQVKKELQAITFLRWQMVIRRLLSRSNWKCLPCSSERSIIRKKQLGARGQTLTWLCCAGSFLVQIGPIAYCYLTTVTETTLFFHCLDLAQPQGLQCWTFWKQIFWKMIPMIFNGLSDILPPRFGWANVNLHFVGWFFLMIKVQRGPFYFGCSILKRFQKASQTKDLYMSSSDFFDVSHGASQDFFSNWRPKTQGQATKMNPNATAGSVKYHHISFLSNLPAKP